MCGDGLVVRGDAARADPLTRFTGTLNDAYMRDYALTVPSDCVASNTEAENRSALEEMNKMWKADIRRSTELDLSSLRISR
jgi:hypothetical protein